MLYLCSLIILIIYFFIFLYIYRYKIVEFLKKFTFRIIPESLILIYINFFTISILNSKVSGSISKTNFFDVANQINSIFFYRFYQLTLFEFIVLIVYLYLIIVAIKAFMQRGYLNKLSYLKTVFVYKYFNEIKIFIILSYVIYIILLYISREYFIYTSSHYTGMFIIFNIYLLLNMFMVMMELEFLLLPNLFEYKINKFNNKNFIKDENYMIYDFNMMFNEKKHLFIELCNYLKYYDKEPLTICIDGKGGSGKSTFACVLQKELNKDYYVFNINGLIFTENNKLNDYFNFIIENLFKAHGVVYNSKILKNYMNIINSVMDDKVTSMLSNFLNEKVQSNYIDIKDEMNNYINKIFSEKSRDGKKGIIFIIDDIERIYNESQIVNILMFSQYILGFNYVKFIFVTNLDVLRKKLDNQYLDMFIHKVFKIDNTSTNDILLKYFDELITFKSSDYDGNLYNWFNNLSKIDFDKYVREFGVYLYNNINLEYYIFTKKWIEYKGELLRVLRGNGMLNQDNIISLNLSDFSYEGLNEYYNYIYFKKQFLGNNIEIVLNNIYKIIKSNKIDLDMYDDDQIIAIWIYLEKNNMIDTSNGLDKNKYRVYKNLTIYKKSIDKTIPLINLKLDNSPRNLKRQISFFLYNFEKLDEYLSSIKGMNSNYYYIEEIVNQKDFILLFIILCFFRISNLINVEDNLDEPDLVSDNINILDIYKFFSSNYEDLKSCSVQGIISFVYDNIDRIDIEEYVRLKGFDNGINYIYICFYVHSYIYKKLILEEVNEDAFEELIIFVDDLIKN